MESICLLPIALLTGNGLKSARRHPPPRIPCYMIAVGQAAMARVPKPHRDGNDLGAAYAAACRRALIKTAQAKTLTYTELMAPPR